MTTTTTTATTRTAAAEAATTSAPHESFQPRGRPGVGAAAARTEELFARHGRMVGGLCRGLLRDRAEAEDAAQQTFLSAHRALLGGTDPREPAAWLATIARNECWARIRTRMREPLPVEELETASLTHDPLAEAIRRADLTALWAAIKALPVQQRDALLLREFGGLRYDELAQALAVTEPAVESLLFRARAQLRGKLRTAYAGLTGATWLEALARVFAGGGAPVAAKVAAIGVGAAAVTGGAVVGPQVFDNHHRQTPIPHRSHPVRHIAAQTVTTVPVAAAVVPMAAPPTDVPAKAQRVVRHTVVARATPSGDESNGGSGDSSSGDEHGPASRATVHSTKQRSESHGSSESGSSGDSSDDSSGDSSGHSGRGHGSGESDHGDGHGLVAPTPVDPGVTIPPPPPPVGGDD